MDGVRKRSGTGSVWGVQGSARGAEASAAGTAGTRGRHNEGSVVMK